MDMSKKVARLYEQFQPEHYDVTLDIDRDNMSFNGTVTVKGKKVGRPSQRLTFHQKDLKITHASALKHDKNGEHPVNITRINAQDSFDEIRLHSDAMVYPGEYTVTMEFTGNINKDMHGIYPCFFEHEGKEKKLIATQFESHHAREALPCIDEPEAKATFDLTLVTPSGETVLGNTPVKSKETDDGRQTTVFETTPRMSVYLLAFVFGEMGYTSGKTSKGIEIRSYATPDNVKLTQMSVDEGVKIMEFFEEYFDVPYPLAKLDMVALPDFNVGAMENWGLMTFRESIMLVDQKTSSIESQQICSLVVSHELSHQWFGNLVTMKWWDDLWLNESFANMMEYRAVDAVHPEWHIWEQFVSHEGASAKRRDSILDVQSVKSVVNHPDDIDTLFDPSIVYAKGGTLLHMLMHYIGEDNFRKGLQDYFTKHSYRNTVADDLWEALGAASNQDIGSFMNSWLLRPGYPLVSIDWKPGEVEAQLSQQRFLSDPDSKSSDLQPWPTPLASTIDLSSNILEQTAATVTVSSKKDNPLLLNTNGTSYFVPHYTQADHRQQIIEALKDHKIGDIDRYLLMDNYVMLQRGGISQAVELLELLSAYQGESSETVWGALVVAISEIRKLIEGDATEDQLEAIIRSTVVPIATKLGWDDQPADDAHTLRLRGMVVGIAVGAKAQDFIDEGLARFKKFNKPSDLPASTRGAVYYCGVRYGDDADFEKLVSLHNSAQKADERDELASGLTSAKQPAHYNQLLEMLTSKHIKRQDFFHWYAWLLRNRYSRAATWQWVSDNWEWYVQDFATDKNFDYIARMPGSVFSTEKEQKDFLDFFNDKRDISTLTHNIGLAEQEIASRVAWRNRNEASVKKWLQTN